MYYSSLHVIFKYFCHWCILHKKDSKQSKFKHINGKGIPTAGSWRHMGDVDARVHIHYIATALGRGRMASSTLSHFIPGESPRYSFYGRLSVPPYTREWRKISTQSTSGIEPGQSSSSQAPCRLSYLVHKLKRYKK